MFHQDMSHLMGHHELTLLGLTLVVSCLSSYTVVLLVRQLLKATIGDVRRNWLIAAACVAGGGMWSTHFLSMLAFAPWIEARYDIAVAAASLIMAILLSAAALLAGRSDGRGGAIRGGIALVVAVAVMHHLGMEGYNPAAAVSADFRYFVLAAIGSVPPAVASFHCARREGPAWRLAASLALTLTIAFAHHVSMAGLTLTPVATALPEGTGGGRNTIAYAIILVSVLTIAAALISISFEARSRRLREDMMKARSLADASIDGLAIFGEHGVIAANRQFHSLTGLDESTIRQVRRQELFPNPGTITALEEAAGTVVEVELMCGSKAIPVEAALHRISMGGEPATAIAVRDLRKYKAAEEEIRRLADCDPLTSLPNRRRFYRELKVALERQSESGETIGILCLDLDRLKQVNDVFGHFAGDRMIERFAMLLKAAIPPSAFVARLGGDEFAIAVPGLQSAAEAVAAAVAIRAALEADNRTGEHEFELSASIGIALCPEHGSDKQSLLTAADIALYSAKSEQRGSCCLFDPEMGRKLIEQQRLEHELRQAVAEGQLFLVYQPQFEAKQAVVSGYEALVRWNRPGVGEVGPTAFIPLAEQCGAILEIGDWVLSTACADAARWDEDVSVSVNVSAVQISSPGFVRRVHEILLESGISARRLHLEITETSLVRNFEVTLLALRQLKAMGVSIVMDDFGTGYSSLAHLQAFPFDKIKIDRSFVRNVGTDPKAATIVRAVLDLGRGLGMPVLAEGVESADELEFLQDADCDEIQGFLLGRPARGAPARTSHPTAPVARGETASRAAGSGKTA